MPPSSLLRPLVVDLWALLWPMLIGVAAFNLGRMFHRWPVAVRAGLIGCIVGLICVVTAALFNAIPRPLELAFSHVGGVLVVLCWMSLGIVGFSWASPERPRSTFFLRYMLVLAPLALIAVESGGSLWFRFESIDQWNNYPGEESGRLVQTTKMSCLPATAAMLLYHYGITGISEGEFAYLANTSFFGTDGHVMARAITQKIGRPDVKARMVNMKYEDLVERGKPFIAQVQLEKIGNHSVLVKSITPNTLVWFDPLEGFDHHVTPNTFLGVWTGSAIIIEGLEPETGRGVAPAK